MAQRLMTPGVYIEEVNAFPGSVVEVATAVPAFIGYTEKASRNGKSLLNQPTRITSLAEYNLLFGGAFFPKFTIDSIPDGQIARHEITINGETKAINYKTDNDAFMYPCIRLFFDNGGGACYVVSVGTYDTPDKVVNVVKDDLEAGLATLLKEQEPTMIVIPDAVKLEDDCYDLYKKVLAHCAKMQSRIAILDVYNGFQPRINSDNVDIIDAFREGTGTEFLNYAAAYYPWLNTNIVQKGDVTFRNLDASVNLSALFQESAAQQLIADFPSDDDGFKTGLIKDKPDDLAAALASDKPQGWDAAVVNNKLVDGFTAAQLDTLLSTGNLKATNALLTSYTNNKKRNFDLGLIATSPTYVSLMDEIRAVMNILPPSGAMAGIYTMVDNSRGVWKSPANVSLNSVVKPAVNITHDEQENLNVDAISGKSINAIRTFPGIGTLVWGGRTLDGNSLDWRYINVRRTMIMLEQSIKLALRSYVFEPNDANTWVTVKSMIINFLTDKWKQGALAGASPADAFDVQIGLGVTMTAIDILEGRMLVTVKLAVVRPAEFIVVTFEQQMQKS